MQTAPTGRIGIAEGQCRSLTIVLGLSGLRAAHDGYNNLESQATKAVCDPVSVGDCLILEGYEA